MVTAGRLVLVVVFGVAAGLKLRDLESTRRGFEAFGVPRRLVAVLAVAVPACEAAVSAGLLLPAATHMAAWAAAGLLLAFSGAIGLNLVTGRRPACNCFGGSRNAPISFRTLVRNLGLAAIAGFVALAGEQPGWAEVSAGLIASARGLDAWMFGIAALVVVLAGVGALFVVLLEVVKQQGRIMLRLEAIESAVSERGSASPEPAPDRPSPTPVQVFGYPAGVAVPDFDLPAVGGGRLSLSSYRGRRLLLVNWNPGCGFCGLIAPKLAGLEARLVERDVALVLVSYGDEVENRALAVKHDLGAPIALQAGAAVEVFRSVGTPAACLVDEAGRLAQEIAVGADPVVVLVEEVANGGASKRPSPLPDRGLPPGAPAPRFSAPDAVSGAVRSLDEFLGSPLVLVFTDPSCRPCDELARRLESPPYRTALPRVLTVSRGDARSNRRKADGRPYPVLVQEALEVAEQFGVLATPAGFLIGADGRIAMPVAKGPDAILDLVGRLVARPQSV